MNKQELVDFLEWYRVAQEVITFLDNKHPERVVDMYLSYADKEDKY